MTTPRTRVVRGIRIYAVGDAGEPLAGTATYAKVENYTPPITALQFIEVTSTLGNDPIPERWEIPTFQMVLNDYSLMPERLMDGALHAFITKEAINAATNGGSEQVYPARYLAYVESVEKGTVQRGALVPMTVTLRPIEVWQRAVGATVSFTGVTPSASDTLRINIRNDIWWCNGVDIMAPRRTALGVT